MTRLDPGPHSVSEWFERPVGRGWVRTWAGARVRMGREKQARAEETPGVMAECECKGKVPPGSHSCG